MSTGVLAFKADTSSASASLCTSSKRLSDSHKKSVTSVRSLRYSCSIRCGPIPEHNNALDTSRVSRINAVADVIPVREAEGHGGVTDKVVGILGGGQLGRMLCQAASPMDLRVVVLDPQENAPAAGMATEYIVGSFKETESIRRLAER